MWDADEEAASDGEARNVAVAQMHEAERVASLQRALESAVRQRNVAVAQMHEAERHAEDAEAAVEAAARAGELAAAEVREKTEQSVATDARIRELEREMLAVRDGEQWALASALEAAATETLERGAARRCYGTSNGC
ncbi:hypothetical protein D1007_29019 [Hordeum vulgare]|nr:hypothetical protein D1007_29019 [Hordeum vulgare]